MGWVGAASAQGAMVTIGSVALRSRAPTHPTPGATPTNREPQLALAQRVLAELRNTKNRRGKEVRPGRHPEAKDDGGEAVVVEWRMELDHTQSRRGRRGRGPAALVGSTGSILDPKRPGAALAADRVEVATRGVDRHRRLDADHSARAAPEPPPIRSSPIVFSPAAPRPPFAKSVPILRSTGPKQ